MRLSARSYVRMLRVARTIADLAGAETVGRIHVAEALSYRRQAYVAAGSWAVRVYTRPFVRWIWLGAALMALGGLVAATDRRFRREQAQRPGRPA